MAAVRSKLMSFRFPWRRGKAEVLGAKAPPAHNNDSLWGSFSLLRLTGRVQLGHFCARRLGEVALTTFRLPGCGGWLDCVMLALGRLLSCPLAHTVRRGTRAAGSITQPLCSAWALCSGASAGEGRLSPGIWCWVARAGFAAPCSLALAGAGHWQQECCVLPSE